MRTSQVFVAREGTEIIATFQLTTKKPWAIDTSYFADCRRPLYLVGMAVARQGSGKESAPGVSRRPNRLRGPGPRTPFGSMPIMPRPGLAVSTHAAAARKSDASHIEARR